MRKLNGLLLSVFIIVFLMSCTSTKSLEPETQIVPLQSLADEGDIILLIDGEKEAELITTLLGEEIGKKAKEITVEIIPIDDSYPLEYFEYNTVIEGDFPFFSTNFALNHYTDFEKVLDSTKTHYKKDNLEIGVIHKNMVGASSKSFLDLVKVVDSKVENVDKLTTLEMYGSNFALYSIKPKTLFDFGLGLNKAIISHFDSILILINENEENSLSMDATIDVDTEKNAQTLEKMIKSGYTGQLRKAGEKLDFAKLRLMFARDDKVLNIIEMPLTEEQVDLFKQTIQSSKIGL